MSSLRTTKHVPKGVHHGHREPEEIEETREEGQQSASLNHARDDCPGAEGDGTQQSQD